MSGGTRSSSKLTIYVIRLFSLELILNVKNSYKNMKQYLLELVKPFKRLSPRENMMATTGVILILMLLWTSSGSEYIPSPLQVLRAFPRLSEKHDIIRNFGKSLEFCFKAMGFSILIAYSLALLSVLPLFSTFCQFLRKFRFLPSTGLSILFLKMGNGYVSNQMLYMMIFGITTWMIDSMIGIALSVTDDEVMYARSLRMSRWAAMREILIYGKAAEMFKAAISNFAMAWMLLAAVENIAKANGGVGVVLAESYKYYKYEEIYAIQLIILCTGILVDGLLNMLRKWIFPYTNLKN